MATQNFRVKNGLEVGTNVTISAGIITATSASFSNNVYIDGYVGINSTTPNVNLDVDGDVNISGSLGVDVSLGVDGILYKKQTPIYFDENNLGEVQIVGSGNNLKFYNPVFGPGGDWIFDTYSYGEVVRITNSGNVGIGTDSPQARAHIYGTGYSELIVQSVPDEFLVQDSSISLTTEFDGSYRIQTGTQVSGGFRIYDGVAGQERLRITSGFEGGNVGIGTTIPSAKLHLVGTGTTTLLVDGNVAVSGILTSLTTYSQSYNGKTGTLESTVGSSLGTTGTVDLNMQSLTGTYQSINMTGDITFTTSNRLIGRSVTLRLNPGASGRTLTYPVDWRFVGEKTTSLSASKLAILTLTFFGSNDSDCIAAIAVEA